jgi:predicted acetyltransferase
MGIEVRNAAPEEYQAAIDVISTGFLERPDLRAVAESVAEAWESRRTWVAFDGDRVCGTFRSTPTRLTVPGGAELPAAAVSAVTVLPSHRRRGILTAMAAREHAALVERGECVGLLYASEYPIYGRFGYAPGTRTADWLIATRATGMLRSPAGSVELVTPNESTREILKGMFEAWRPRQAGEISRRDVGWDSRLGLREEPWGERWKGWVLLHRDATGVVDGYARYKAIPKWEGHGPQAVVEVQELLALTPDAYAGMIRFLLELDLVATVKLEGRRESEPVRWLLTNARAARPADAGDALWVRLFDVPRALAARTYERVASLVLEVVDDEAWGGTRRLHLDATPDGATCSPTDRSPDLTLPVAALGGAYLGGTRLRDLVLATGADEHRPGALAEADALLRTAEEPWCSTFF